ncbi:hypothetical protein [Chroococcidiopsis sp.]|uniref:hypothetical protein n=1 Tax=Chroococcidiopsis sp. TaxID=3088168 RepID=UPI003F2DFA33
MLASLKALLTSVVDYAGLFPPAKLDLRQAMENYVQDSASPYAWMLNRFVIPISRLSEFAELLSAFSLKHWSLSVILSGLQSEIEQLRSLNHSDNVAIAALEFSPLSPPEIERVLPDLPTGVEAFFEIPFNRDLEPYLKVLRHTGTAAKIRTGGATIGAFPSVTQLSQCMYLFAEAQIPFKATAGLHHPLPAKYPLTSEPDSPATLMHGFLNVATLAALAYWQKVTPTEALELLQESSNTFQFKQDSICWRDRCLDILEIEAARQHFFRSFGSCSFQEPVNDLKHVLNW